MSFWFSFKTVSVTLISMVRFQHKNTSQGTNQGTVDGLYSYNSSTSHVSTGCIDTKLKTFLDDKTVVARREPKSDPASTILAFLWQQFASRYIQLIEPKCKHFIVQTKEVPCQFLELFGVKTSENTTVRGLNMKKKMTFEAHTRNNVTTAKCKIRLRPT